MIGSGRVEGAGALAADADPVKTAVGRDAVGDALGGEHHLVVVAEATGRSVGIALLVPHHPRNRVLDAVGVAGERDVGLDAVARRVYVQARIRVAGPDSRDAGLLEAEAADRGNMPSGIGDASGGD